MTLNCLSVCNSVKICCWPLPQISSCQKYSGSLLLLPTCLIAPSFWDLYDHPGHGKSETDPCTRKHWIKISMLDLDGGFLTLK